MLKNHLEAVKSRIYDLKKLKQHLHIWKLKGKKVVFTNGCFDLLHPGHVTYLAKAADLGDVLIVGMNADKSVKKLNKGSNRPIMNQDARALVLASLHVVDAVIVFDEETPYELIKSVLPDVLVKGGDWKPEEIVGSDIVLNNGGEVKSVAFLEGYSTSAIEAKIKSSNG